MEGGMRYDGVNWLNLVIIAQMALSEQAAGRADRAFPHARIFPSSIKSMHHVDASHRISNAECRNACLGDLHVFRRLHAGYADRTHTLTVDHDGYSALKHAFEGGSAQE